MMENHKLLAESEVSGFIDTLIRTSNPVVLGFLNQHAYNLMCSSPSIKATFSEVDYLLRDGKGMEFAYRYWGLNPGANLNGTDFIPVLIDTILSSGIEARFFAYGTQTPWLEKGADRLFHGNDFMSLDGFQPPGAYTAHFGSNQTPELLNVVLLAMGMPKQEEVSVLLKTIAKGPVLIICGGAILDFQSGRISRAPVYYRRLGLEWLYRLAKEPRRLFKRYVVGIPVFIFNIVKW